MRAWFSSFSVSVPKHLFSLIIKNFVQVYARFIPSFFCFVMLMQLSEYLT